MHATDRSPAAAREVATEQVLVAVRAHLHGAEIAPLYLAAGQPGLATALLAAAAAEVRSVGRGERTLACTGADFVGLWRDTLCRGMTPFVRRALAAKRAILLDDLEALRGEPFAQGELARLIVPERLAVLAGRDHPPRLAAWSPSLDAPLRTARTVCLHEGPCVADADAWAIIDQVAGYYGFTRAQLLARRRTAPIALARQVAMHLLRQEGLTADRVGQLLHRDHSTVLHGDARPAARRRRGARPPRPRHPAPLRRRGVAMDDATTLTQPRGGTHAQSGDRPLRGDARHGAADPPVRLGRPRRRYFLWPALPRAGGAGALRRSSRRPCDRAGIRRGGGHPRRPTLPRAHPDEAAYGAATACLEREFAALLSVEPLGDLDDAIDGLLEVARGERTEDEG